MLLFLVREEWPACAVTQMQGVLLMQSVTDLEGCDAELITRLAVLLWKETDAADNESRARIKARIVVWARKVIEDSATEARKWLKKPQNPQMI